MRFLSIIKIAMMFVILELGAMCGATTIDQEEELTEEDLRRIAEEYENGPPAAQFEIGSAYDLYFKNYTEAERWYRKAAENDHTAAQNNLGNIYLKEDNYQEALKWYRKAASKDGKLNYNLGLMYIYGKGVETNIKKGLRLVILSAQEDDAMAQYKFGNIMNDNERYEDAYYWLTLAQKKEKNLEVNNVNIDSLSTRLDELEDLIDHKKIDELQEETGDGWRPKQLKGGGSGFYIKEGFVLTNAHVINPCNWVPDLSRVECTPCDEVRVQGDYHYRAVVEEKDLDVDLALLRISSDLSSEKYRQSASFRSESASLQLGEGVAVFGYPLPGRLSFEGNFTIGNVSSIEGRPTDITPSDSFQFTAPIQRGNSGGPVLDAAGNVVGAAANLQTDILKDKNIAQNINFAVSLKAIGKFLEKAGVEPDSVSSSDTRKEWTEIAGAAQGFTVPVLCFEDMP